jgi:predicted transcriptional regulator
VKPAVRIKPGENFMSKTITIRIDDKKYKMFKSRAEQENRPISNFVETAVLNYLQSTEYADEFEMDEINRNKELRSSILRGVKDVKAGKGRFH